MENGSHWRDMLNQPPRSTQQLGGDPSAPLRAPAELGKDDDLTLETTDYQPWVLQRGRARPAALLDLRWYDARASLWLGCAIAYPQHVAAEYIGERMVSLDFGKRQFVLEGEGLGELVRRIQDGSVIAIQEYAPAIWPQRVGGPIVSSIKRVAAGAETTPPR